VADPVETFLLSEARRAADGTFKLATLPPLHDGQQPVEFAFALLPGHVRQLALQRAIARLRSLEIPPEFMGYDVVNAEERWQLLWQAMRDPRTPHREKVAPWRWRPIAKDTDALRELLTEEERDKLWNDYLDFAEERDPKLDDFPPESQARVRDALKKKDLRGLVSCGSSSLANYLLTLADPWATCSTPSSSPGSGNATEPLPS
jgi:hypothetical protein